MHYQFQIDNRPAGPIRKTWLEAATDAVTDGYAFFMDDRRVSVKLDAQAKIARIETIRG